MKIANLTRSNPFKKFSDTHSLVYNDKFLEEAHPIVRGMTLSTKRKDHHYTMGSLYGHDVILLERTVDFHKPGRDAITFKWVILHSRLQAVDNLPHIFLDGNNRYHEDVYQSIFTKFAKLVLAPNPNQSPFMNSYRVFCNSETIPSLPDLLAPKLTDKLSTLGHSMDYEILDNKIYVYLPTSADTTNELEMMFSALKTLVEWFENLSSN